MTEMETLTSLGSFRVIATLKHYGSVRRAARSVGVSHTALLRYMRSEQIPMPNIDPETREWWKHLAEAGRGRVAPFGKWLLENPKVKLPMSIKGIQEITGLTRWQIQSYISRERKARRVALSELKLAGKRVKWTSESGETVDFAKAKRIEYSIGRFSCRVTMTVTTVKGEAEVEKRYPITDYQAFIQAAQKGFQ